MFDDDDDFDFEELRQKWQAARKKEFDFDEWAKVRLLLAKVSVLSAIEFVLQEIETHPAFMTSMPQGGELSEAAAALQAMKYDDSDDAEGMVGYWRTG